MSTVTDAGTIQFLNQYVRPLADLLAEAHTQAKLVCFLWEAKGYNALVPNDASTIDDGSMTGGAFPGSPDGRTPIVGSDVNNLIAIAAAFYQNNEANSNANIMQIGKIAVNAS